MKLSIEAIIDERTGELVSNLKFQNPFCFSMEYKIKKLTESLKDQLDIDASLKLTELLDELDLKNTVESKYLYCQGMKDVVYISNFLETELLDKCFIKSADDED